jgi:hypothetical protein
MPNSTPLLHIATTLKDKNNFLTPLSCYFTFQKHFKYKFTCISKVHHHMPFLVLTASVASAGPASQVRPSAMLLLVALGNEK